MEKGSMIGLGLCLVGVFASATMHGINIAFLFMEFGSIIIVVFGHLGATIASYPWEATQNVGKYIGKAMKERHKIGMGWFTSAGVFAPTFGIIGAVFGLMATMAQLNQPAKVGEGIAGAFVATFWGVFLANGVWLPWANKLKQLSLTEVAHKQLIVEGIMAIQAGVSPRVVEELLKSHIPPAEREKAEPAAAAGSGGGQTAAAA